MLRLLATIGRVALFVCLFGVVGVSSLAQGAQDTLRIGIAQSANTLDPILSTELSESFLATLVFDGLVSTTGDGNLQPRLAARVPSLANGDISRDGRTIVYHLRHDVRWQDGKPFTSRDVAFTQAAHMNPANDVVTRAPYDRVTRLDTPDPYTVVVHLNAPYAPFIAEWNAGAILPAHLLAGKPSLNDDAFNAHPLGTGPFIFDHWDRGREVVYRVNDAYVLGKPGVRRIVVTEIPNENSALIALRTGDIDWLFEPSPTAAREFGTSSDFQLDQFATNAHYGIRLNTSHPPLDDVRVRRALSYAIDREALVRTIGAGLVDVATADLPSFSWAYDPTLHPIRYDPARARALFTAAGWRPGADGILRKGNQRMSLTLVYGAAGASAEAVAIQVESTLRANGIDLTLKGVEPNIMFAPASAGGILQGGTFDLAWSGFFSGDDPDDSRLYGCAAQAPHGHNISRWCNPAFEHWTNVALSHDDRPTRARAYSKMQHLLIDDAPELFVWWPHDLQLHRRTVTNLAERGGLAPAYRWTLR